MRITMAYPRVPGLRVGIIASLSSNEAFLEESSKIYE